MHRPAPVLTLLLRTDLILHSSILCLFWRSLFTGGEKFSNSPAELGRCLLVTIIIITTSRFCDSIPRSRAVARRCSMGLRDEVYRVPEGGGDGGGDGLRGRGRVIVRINLQVDIGYEVGL